MYAFAATVDSVWANSFSPVNFGCAPSQVALDKFLTAVPYQPDLMPRLWAEPKKQAKYFHIRSSYLAAFHLSYQCLYH